jgi:hypothetical protein
MKAIIKDTITGGIRTYIPEFGDSLTDEENTWQWTEGNFGCDCNRSIFYTDWEEEHPCHKGRFKVILVNKFGNCFYREFYETPEEEIYHKQRVRFLHGKGRLT